MINPSEEVFIREYAYVPEHMPGNATAISGKEPFLLEGYLCYYGQDTLLFVGYPLKESFHENKMDSVLETAVGRFKPAQVVLMAPTISRRLEQRGPVPSLEKFRNIFLRAQPPGSSALGTGPARWRPLTSPNSGQKFMRS